MSVGPIERLGSEKLPEGVSSEGSKMSLGKTMGIVGIILVVINVGIIVPVVLISAGESINKPATLIKSPSTVLSTTATTTATTGISTTATTTTTAAAATKTTITTATTTVTTTTTTTTTAVTTTTTTTSVTQVMRYLIAYGIFGKNKTEIVDVSDPTKSCILEADDIAIQFGSTEQSYWLGGGTGGLLGTTPVICGGNVQIMTGMIMTGMTYLNECLLYGTSQVITLNSVRGFHSSIMLNDSMLWIMGGKLYGYNGYHVLDSTEFVTTEMVVNGPTLPEPVYHHCAVKLPGNGFVYLTGGISTYHSSGIYGKVWVANPSNEFTFVQGPSLITARVSHTCGAMSIGAKNIIIVAGGVGEASVEILDPPTNQWVSGPEMPYDVYGGAMASSPDGNGVILAGGTIYSSGHTDSILELKSDGQGWVGSWTILTTKLHHPRAYHVLIPVIMDINSTCSIINLQN